jgi:[acyl-carrier-protein] S-malonyltransferase
MSFAFVFPGQGSQSVGMMAAYGDSAVVRATFDEASAALGDDLWAMVAEGPAEALAQTVNTQPVMLTAGIAVWRLWQEKGGRMPAILAGHSLGEYSALVAAGVIGLKDAVPLVRLRAAAMQEAVPVGTGAMAAILGLDNAGIAAACAEAAQGEVVEPVNFNANGPNRHCRPQGGGRARHGGLQGPWRQDGQGAAGIRAVPFFADSPGC